MDHFNAIRGTVTVGGTGNLTVSATGAGKGRPLSTLTSGWTGGLRFDDPNGVDWEISLCTMLTTTTLSRDTLLCSSTGSKVSLAAGATVLQTVVAEQLNSFLSAVDISYSTAIPLTRPGNSYMASQTVGGALTFTAAAGAVRGALVYLRLIADGTNIPNYSAFKEWGGSLGYDNRNGIENQMQFFFDGFNYFVSISQALGAVAIVTPTAITLSGPTDGIISTASSNYSVNTDGVRSASVVVAPTPVANVTFTPSSVTLAAGTSPATFTATSTTTGAKSIAVTNNGGLANPSAITFTVAAAATAPATMAAPVATAGDTTASVVMVAPSNGGSAITGYTVTSSPAGMTDSNAGSTSLTHLMTGGTNGTAYTFTARATNTIGTSAASPASNSVTPTAAVPRYINRAFLNESGTSPNFVYTGTGQGYDGTGQGGISSVALQAGVDGYWEHTIGSMGNCEPMLGVLAGTAPVSFSSIPYILWASGGAFKQFTSGSQSATATAGTSANSTIMRMTRTNSNQATATLTASCSNDGGTTYTNLHSWTGVSTGILRFIGIMGGGPTPGTFTNLKSSGLS